MWYAITMTILWTALAALLICGIYYLKAEYRREQELKARAERWHPRYIQDRQRACSAMTADELQAYAEKHWKRITNQYHRRDLNGGDPYWKRAVQPLPDEYVEYLTTEKYGSRILAWYNEPETLFNLALAVRSTKTPAQERTEWILERHEMPEHNRDEFRRKIEEGDHAAA